MGYLRALRPGWSNLLPRNTGCCQATESGKIDKHGSCALMGRLVVAGPNKGTYPGRSLGTRRPNGASPPCRQLILEMKEPCWQAGNGDRTW